MVKIHRTVRRTTVALACAVLLAIALQWTVAQAGITREPASKPPTGAVLATGVPATESAALSATAPVTSPAAAIVVVQTDQGVVVRPITFTQPLSGLAALLATGLDVAVAESSFGPAVCAIEGVGCPADDCFCNANEFWNYAYAQGGAWQGYAVGAGASVITQTGALEGWRWGAFEGTMAISPARAQAAVAALMWLQGQQSAKNGGYGGMSGTAETMLAIGANGIAADAWRAEGASPSLQTHARIHQAKFSRKDVASAGKTAAAIAAADACWTANAIRPSAWFSDTLGAYAPHAGFNAWGILGTLAVSETVPTSAVENLRESILPEGAWEWQSGFGPDTNTTALAIQTLIAAGEPVTATEIVSGLAYLRQAQQPDGGFAYDLKGGFGSDANSTAYVIQALAAAGEDAESEAWRVDGHTAIDWLLSVQMADGGFAWQPGTGSNLAATQQAIPALLGRAYPIAVKAVERCTRR